jgi:hypothetical protein
VTHLDGENWPFSAERGVLALLRHLPRERVEATVVNLVDFSYAPKDGAVRSVPCCRGAHLMPLDAENYRDGAFMSPSLAPQRSPAGKEPGAWCHPATGLPTLGR